MPTQPTMLAAVIKAPGQIQLEELALPQPGPRQVRIRLEGCGLCGSNLPIWEGRNWFNYPYEAGAPGHEGWGWIDAVGDAVTGVKLGDRVAALSYNAFAQYDLAADSNVVQLPAALDSEAVPVEPLACALNIFARSGIKPGQTVAIVGIGFLGALLVQMATRLGARVLALSRRASAVQLAQALGAETAIVMDDHWRVLEQVKALTDGNWCDVVIEATGKQWPLDLAAELTAVRGRLVVAGFHQDGLRQINMQLWNWRGLDVINAHERDPAIYIQGMHAAITALQNQQLNLAPLLTHTFKFSELSNAFEMLQNRPEGFIKAVIQIGEG